MDNYKVRGIIIFAVAQILAVMEIFIWNFGWRIYGSSFYDSWSSIYIALNVIVAISLFVGAVILEKDSKSAFKGLQLLALLNFFLSFLNASVITYIGSMFSMEIAIAVNYVISFTISISLILLFAKGLTKLTNSAGVRDMKGLRDLILVIAVLSGIIQTIFAVTSVLGEYMDMTETVFLINLAARALFFFIAIATGMMLKGKTNKTHMNSSTNYNSSYQAGHSTRDEIYRQFEGK